VASAPASQDVGLRSPAGDLRHWRHECGPAHDEGDNLRTRRTVIPVSDNLSPALATHLFLHGMREDHLAVLAQAATEVMIPAGHHLFEEGGNARRFWLIESGRVALDLQIPGEGPAVIENIGMGELLGWSWLFPPYQWAFGAVTVSDVRAFEFDAASMRARCAAEPEFGHELTRRVAVVLARRLRTTRIKLLSCRSGRDGPPWATDL
jgi:CRP/FNR family cyclic AMP-dependent transcriptional regulator